MMDYQDIIAMLQHKTFTDAAAGLPHVAFLGLPLASMTLDDTLDDPRRPSMTLYDPP